MPELRVERGMMKSKSGVDLFFRLSIITYELGDLHRALVYGHSFSSEQFSHVEEAKLALADLFIQLSILCFELGFSEPELKMLGWDHLRDRYKDFDKRGWSEHSQDRKFLKGCGIEC